MGVGQRGLGLPPLSAGMTVALELERGIVAGRLPQRQGAQGWDGNQEASNPQVGLWGGGLAGPGTPPLRPSCLGIQEI